MTHKELIQKIKEIENKYGITEWHEVWYKYIDTDFQRDWLPDTTIMKLSEYMEYRDPTFIKKTWIAQLEDFNGYVDCNSAVVEDFDNEINELFEEYDHKNK